MACIVVTITADAELLQRRQRHGQHNRGAVRIGDDLPFHPRLRCCSGNNLQMIGVDLRHQQRNVRVHAVIARVRYHHVAGLRERLLNLGRHRRVHRRKHQAVERSRLALLHRDASTLDGITPPNANWSHRGKPYRQSGRSRPTR
jgi:hypothetical protein